MSNRAHFARFKVTEIALSGNALAQFDLTGILAAAELLSHARCQVIGWSGTAAEWLGFEADQHLCAAIERQTGARACTSVLALNEVFALTGVRRFGLISPEVLTIRRLAGVTAGLQAAQCTNSAMRMMMGIGMPRKNSSSERIDGLL